MPDFLAFALGAIALKKRRTGGFTKGGRVTNIVRLGRTSQAVL